MRNIFLLSLIVAFALTQGAHAQSIRPYVSMHGSFTALPDDTRALGAQVESLEFDQGYAAGAALGLEQRGIIWLPSRFEGEIAYYDNEATINDSGQSFGGNTTATSFMGNIYYDLGMNWAQPYIGAGLGYLHTSLDIGDANYADESEGVFAYQLMAGLNVALTDDGSVVGYGGYRYLGSTDPDIENRNGMNIKPDIDRHMVQAGIRFGF